MDQKLLQFLENHHISYTPYEHEAVFTVDAADRVFPNIAWMHVKNLFLKDRKNTFYLVCVEAHKRLPIKDFARKFGLKELSFWSPEQLKEKMNLTPWSVSLFWLIYAKDIKVFIDEDIRNAEHIWRHPNVNTATIMITHAWLEIFLEALSLSPTIFDFNEFVEQKN